MTFIDPWHFCLCGPFPPQNIFKIIFYVIGIKMSIIQTRFIISQGLTLLLISKNPSLLGVPENIFLVFNKVKIEIFLLVPKI